MRTLAFWLGYARPCSYGEVNVCKLGCRRSKLLCLVESACLLQQIAGSDATVLIVVLSLPSDRYRRSIVMAGIASITQIKITLCSWFAARGPAVVSGSATGWKVAVYIPD